MTVSEAQAVAVVRAVLGGRVMSTEYSQSLSDRRRQIVAEKIAELEARSRES